MRTSLGLSPITSSSFTRPESSSIVTSGKTLTDREVDKLCKLNHTVARSFNIELCASHGLLQYEQLKRLAQSGVRRYHCNLETSRRFFSKICTTHSYDDKLKAIQNAQKAGLGICSGGIMGLGETMEDRVDMALELHELGIESVPVNVLSPIAGTPLAQSPVLATDEICRIVAIYRFILPKAAIRMAGGRGAMDDNGAAVFQSGANAAISGNMLTTARICTKNDKEMLGQLGYRLASQLC